MDAFSGYNQIFMHPDDREKTAFITDRGTYCYKVMPFGLKNAGATYQRLVNKMFADQLGRSMEVYIDDMLVKSAKAHDHRQTRSRSRRSSTSHRRHPPKKSHRTYRRIEQIHLALNRQVSPLLPIASIKQEVRVGQKCEDAFKQLKEYLTTPPILAKPEEGETLLLYIAISSTAVSGVLVREDRGEQQPVFYVSKTLNDAETRYPTLENWHSQ
ncbi:unnamed protein product [Microthlaspi erraticum]|uniref:Reverse transcriptase domain-containing protein n=1 Tax=Microthlaspi erraticum TaxID=1685480 RepID=A0A6D2HPA4_9BRAS|nr:unnamed protein product [Microthlaspi erraticum]